VELSGYLAVARRWWWTLIVAAWIAGLTGYLVATTIPPTYESQVKVLVGPLNTDTDTLRASGFLVQTYAQYVTTREVLSSTIQELGLDLAPEDLAAATRATANDVTRILTIRVQADDPQTATDLANTIATELEQLTSQGLSRPEGLTQIIEFARPDETPVAPQVTLLVLLSAAAGMVVATILVLLLEYFGNTVRTRQELASLAKAALLGAVPAPANDPPDLQDLIALDGPSARAAAPYRLISSKLALGTDGTTLRSILVTDTDSEGEAAVVGANLAAAFIRLGRRVVVVDGSGPDGSLTRMHGWQGRPGLTDLMASDRHAALIADPADAAIAGLPAGRGVMDSADPDRLRTLIDRLAGEDGIVVVVCGPVQTTPIMLAFARATDAVILVGRRDRSRRDDVAYVAETLRSVDAPLAGVILAERSFRGLRRDERPAATRTIVPVEIGPEVTSSRSQPTNLTRTSRPRPSTGHASGEAESLSPG
jgi:tyrosine-protein kinase